MSFITLSLLWLSHLWNTKHSHLERFIRISVYFFPDLPARRHVRVLKVNVQSQADRSQVLQGFQD